MTTRAPLRLAPARLVALAPTLLVALALLGLGGCLESDSLGDEPPDTVKIVGEPTWQNGVAKLMDLKCAVCHTRPVPDIAPSTVPRDLDLGQYTLSGTTRGAQDIQLFLRAGILHGSVAGFPRMPLDYSTPLVSSERAALLTWATDNPLPDVAGTTAADGLVLYAAYCQGCHGVGGRNGKYTDVHGNDPVIIQSVIQQAVADVPTMAAWPGLAGLTLAQQQAIATYLAQP